MSSESSFGHEFPMICIEHAFISHMLQDCTPWAMRWKDCNLKTGSPVTRRPWKPNYFANQVHKIIKYKKQRKKGNAAHSWWEREDNEKPWHLAMTTSSQWWSFTMPVHKATQWQDCTLEEAWYQSGNQTCNIESPTVVRSIQSSTHTWSYFYMKTAAWRKTLSKRILLSMLVLNI